MKITNDDTNCLALILEDIANTLRESGADEWEDIDDCVRGTMSNVQKDFREYVFGN